MLVQAVVTEFLICYAEDLFAQDQGADSGPDSLEQVLENSKSIPFHRLNKKTCYKSFVK